MAVHIINSTSTTLTVTSGDEDNLKLQLGGVDLADIKQGTINFNSIFLENNNTVEFSYIIEKNTFSAGTISISEGVTVEVSEGVEWVIV